MGRMTVRQRMALLITEGFQKVEAMRFLWLGLSEEERLSLPFNDLVKLYSVFFLEGSVGFTEQVFTVIENKSKSVEQTLLFWREVSSLGVANAENLWKKVLSLVKTREEKQLVWNFLREKRISDPAKFSQAWRMVSEEMKEVIKAKEERLRETEESKLRRGP